MNAFPRMILAHVLMAAGVGFAVIAFEAVAFASCCNGGTTCAARGGSPPTCATGGNPCSDNGSCDISGCACAVDPGGNGNTCYCEAS